MTEIEMNAKAELADIENAAMAGKPVTADQLAAARERVTLAGLVARGAEGRAEKARELTAAEVREAAKLQTAALFAVDEDDLLAAYDAAVSALEVLAHAVEARGERIDEAERILRQGGVPARAWDGSYPDGFDGDNFASMQQGGTASSVTIDGKGYTPEFAALWVAAAVRAVSHMHGGLQLPYGGGQLESKVEFDRPRAIQARHSAE